MQLLLQEIIISLWVKSASSFVAQISTLFSHLSGQSISSLPVRSMYEKYISQEAESKLFAKHSPMGGGHIFPGQVYSCLRQQ